MVKKMIIGAAAVAALIGFAAPANANPDSYLRALRGHGINVNNPGGAVNDGYVACNELRAGQDFGHVAAVLQKRNPGLNGGDAYFEVSAAQQNLC